MSGKNETELNIHFRRTNTDPVPPRKGAWKSSSLKLFCIIAFVLLIVLFAVVYWQPPDFGFSGKAIFEYGRVVEQPTAAVFRKTNGEQTDSVD